MLLAAANRVQDSPESATPWERDVDRALTEVSQGRSYFAPLTEWQDDRAMFALVWIYEHVRSGKYHLRRCHACKGWMFLSPPRAHRWLCNRPDCQQRVKTAKKAQLRADERERQRAWLSSK